MNNEATLREKAREVIQSGKLPAMKPSRTWGGPGSGTECSVCGEPVKPDQMELEIEYCNGGTRDLDHYHLHVRCFAAWECESPNHLASGTIFSNHPCDPASPPPRLAAAPLETNCAPGRAAAT